MKKKKKGKGELQNAPGIILLRSDGKMPSISRTMATLNIYIIYGRDMEVKEGCWGLYEINPRSQLAREHGDSEKSQIFEMERNAENLPWGQRGPCLPRKEKQVDLQRTKYQNTHP